jgi:magnesium-transporting ATPase (P-type)
MITTYEFTTRIALAASLEAAIGIERQWRQKNAGLRTNTLVSLRSTAFILLSVSLGNGADSSIFDFATFVLMFFYFKANSPELQSFFQSDWFIEGLLSQTLIIHMIRTKKVLCIQSWVATLVVALITLIMLMGIAIPFSPLALMLKIQPLPLSYFSWLFGILTSYCLLTQFIKTWFIRKFNHWL